MRGHGAKGDSKGSAVITTSGTGSETRMPAYYFALIITVYPFQETWPYDQKDTAFG